MFSVPPVLLVTPAAGTASTAATTSAATETCFLMCHSSCLSLTMSQLVRVLVPPADVHLRARPDRGPVGLLDDGQVLPAVGGDQVAREGPNEDDVVNARRLALLGKRD